MIINDLYLTRSVHLLVEIKNTLRNDVERNFTKNYFLKLLSFRNLTDKVSTPGDDAVANNLSGSSFGSEIYSAILSSQPNLPNLLNTVQRLKALSPPVSFHADENICQSLRNPYESEYDYFNHI
jgi:hypothetical protein